MLNNKNEKKNYINNYIFISKSPDNTKNIGKKIGSILRKGDLIALNGELGAGKTCLVQGIAIGMDCNQKVSSPSFSIIKEYSARLPIYHFDLYRLDRAEEIEELGYEEYFYGNGITLIEWADKIESYLPKEYLSIEIRLEKDFLIRKIIIKHVGQRFKTLMEELKNIEDIRN